MFLLILTNTESETNPNNNKMKTIAAIDAIKKKQIKDIVVMCIVSCPEGIAAVESKHPDVMIYTASIDSHLNENNYIVPGLGDAGDRLFGTD